MSPLEQIEITERVVETLRTWQFGPGSIDKAEVDGVGEARINLDAETVNKIWRACCDTITAQLATARTGL